MQRLGPVPDLLEQTLHVSEISGDFLCSSQFTHSVSKEFLNLELLRPVLAPREHRTELN